jgi:hypothetical protein
MIGSHTEWSETGKTESVIPSDGLVFGEKVNTLM